MCYMSWLDHIRATLPKPEKSASTVSISDPAFAEFFGIGARSTAGQNVTEASAIGFTAVYRAVDLLSSAVAGLPLKSYRTLEDDSRQRVKSFLDDPGGPEGAVPFVWMKLLMVHLLLHGNGYGLHIPNGAGAIGALQLLHPACVNIKEDRSAPGGKVFGVKLASGETRDVTSQDLTHFMGLSLDGIRGVSPITAARNSIGTGLAGDVAAARMFRNGLLHGGLVSGEGLDEEEGKGLIASLKAKLAGADHAGEIALVNANLKFSPWTMSAEDAQFIESRQYQVEEIARIYGVPKVLLAEDGASTWGSGIAELIRGMQKFTLISWTTPIEQTLSRLLARPRFCEFDFAGLLQPTEAEATDNMVKEIEVGLLTVDEGRRLKNRQPLNATTPQEESE